jgi:hypothetical protein
MRRSLDGLEGQPGLRADLKEARPSAVPPINGKHPMYGHPKRILH